MRTRFSFIALAALLTAILVVALLPSMPAPAPLSPAPETAISVSVPFVPYPTRPAKTSTSLPRQPVHTAAPIPTFAAVPSETLITFPSRITTAVAGTSTPSVPIAFSQDGNSITCYKGPAVEYIVKTTFKLAQIIGKDRAGQWWYLVVNKGQNIFVYCWVSTRQVITAGNLSTVLVYEPELAQITRVEIDPPGQPATVSCGSGAGEVIFHFTGRIFADGPLENLGYTWETDTPLAFPPEQTSVESWNIPAEIQVEIPAPAQAGIYSLRLRSLYPMEASGELKFEVSCQSPGPA